MATPKQKETCKNSAMQILKELCNTNHAEAVAITRNSNNSNNSKETLIFAKGPTAEKLIKVLEDEAKK
jgi:hypothetical protein